MQNQVTIIDNGVSQNVELISYFELTNLGKKFIFYTLNEKVENNLVKMYAAVAENNGKTFTLGQEMTDDEWNTLKGVMKTILTGGNDVNVKYIYVD